MPLQSGRGTLRRNVGELMNNVDSPARRKALNTIARNRGVSLTEAKFIQALAISKKLERK